MANTGIDPETLQHYLELATTGEGGDLRAALEDCVSELIGIGYQLPRRQRAAAGAAPSYGQHAPAFQAPPSLSAFLQDLDL